MKNKKIVAIMAFVALFCNTSQATTRLDDFLKRLNTPGSQRILDEKTEQELEIERQIEEDLRNEYLKFLKDPQAQQFIGQQAQETENAVKEITEIHQLFATLQAAQKYGASKKTIENGFENFKKLQKIIEDGLLQQQKEQEEFLKATEPYQEQIKDFNTRQENKKRLLESETPNLLKTIIASEIRKQERDQKHWKAAAEIKKQRDFAKKSFSRE
jgi:hypothetical protein